MFACEVPQVEVLLVTGGVRTEYDLYRLHRAVQRTDQVVAVGTCAISGGVTNLGDRQEVREVFLAQAERLHLPDLLPRCHPVDTVVEVDQNLPGCPSTPELYMEILRETHEMKISRSVCQECGLKKVREIRPTHLIGF